MEKVRERIVRGAMKVFSTHGYFKAPVSKIAREAGVSKGLVFWYFRSKDELIHEAAARSLPIDILRECLETVQDKEELLRCVGERYLKKYSDPVMRNLMLQTLAVRTIYPEVEERLREMCSMYTRKMAKQIFGKDDVESRVKIRSFFGSLLCYSLRPPPDISVEEYLDNLITIILQ